MFDVERFSGFEDTVDEVYEFSADGSVGGGFGFAVGDEAVEEFFADGVVPSCGFGGVPEHVSEESVSVLGHAAWSFVFSGLDSSGVGAQVAFEGVDVLEAIDASDGDECGRGGEHADAGDRLHELRVFVGVGFKFGFDLFAYFALALFELLEFVSSPIEDFFGGGCGVVREVVDLLFEDDGGMGEPLMFGQPGGEVFAIGVEGDAVLFEDFRFSGQEQTAGLGDGVGVGGVGFGLDHRGAEAFEDAGIELVQPGDGSVEGVDEGLGVDAGGLEDDVGVWGIGHRGEKFFEASGVVGEFFGGEERPSVFVFENGDEGVLGDVESEEKLHAMTPFGEVAKIGAIGFCVPRTGTRVRALHSRSMPHDCPRTFRSRGRNLCEAVKAAGANGDPPVHENLS